MHDADGLYIPRLGELIMYRDQWYKIISRQPSDCGRTCDEYSLFTLQRPDGSKILIDGYKLQERVTTTAEAA